MSYGITYLGESLTPLEETLRFVHQQPSRWFVSITYESGEITGTILDLEESAVTVVELDEDDAPTGVRTRVLLEDVWELVVH